MFAAQTGSPSLGISTSLTLAAPEIIKVLCNIGSWRRLQSTFQKVAEDRSCIWEFSDGLWTFSLGKSWKCLFGLENCENGFCLKGNFTNLSRAWIFARGFVGSYNRSHIHTRWNRTFVFVSLPGKAVFTYVQCRGFLFKLLTCSLHDYSGVVP